MSHACPECGLEHGIDEPDVVVEAPPTDAVVAVAEIEAERDVTLARIAAKSAEDEREARIAALEGRFSGMQEMLDRLSPPAAEPEPEPVPVIVAPPEPEPVTTEPAAEPPPVAEPAPKKAKGGNPFWR